MDTVSRQMTATERDTFLYAVGQQFAFKGDGIFRFYETVEDAWKDAKRFPAYRVLKFAEGLDSFHFARGYNDTKAALHAMWKVKADAEATIKDIAASIDLSAQSYVYDKDKPAPFLYDGVCANEGCGKDIIKCNCAAFKGRRNPEYDKWMAWDK